MGPPPPGDIEVLEGPDCLKRPQLSDTQEDSDGSYEVFRGFEFYMVALFVA